MTDAIVRGTLSVFDRFAFARQIGLQERPLLRLLLLECERNLGLLACLDLGDSVPQHADGYLRIARRLETAALEMVLGSGDLASKAFKALKAVPLLPEDDADVEQDPRPPGVVAESTSVAERLRRLYVNTTVIRTVAELWEGAHGPPSTGLRSIRFRTRLGNLKRVLRVIAPALRTELGGDAA